LLNEGGGPALRLSGARLVWPQADQPRMAWSQRGRNNPKVKALPREAVCFDRAAPNDGHAMYCGEADM